MATTCYYALLQSGGRILLQSGGKMRLHKACVTIDYLGGGPYGGPYGYNLLQELELEEGRDDEEALVVWHILMDEES